MTNTRNWICIGLEESNEKCEAIFLLGSRRAPRSLHTLELAAYSLNLDMSPHHLYLLMDVGVILEDLYKYTFFTRAHLKQIPIRKDVVGANLRLHFFLQLFETRTRL